MTIKLYLGDCLDILPTLTEQVDAIITDLPYGSTACKWDIIIPFDPMWEQVKRVLKPRGVFVTTASQPFTSLLVCSNLEWFKYEWIWHKDKGGNIACLNYQPSKTHENILVFSEGTNNYYPEMETRPLKNRRNNKPRVNKVGIQGDKEFYIKNSRGNLEIKYPTSVKYFNSNRIGSHPTQKPVALYEYLIRTYTNEGDTVLDIAAGSGTTGEAAIKTNRNCILIEKEEKYFAIAEKRIADAKQQMRLL